MLIIYFRLRHGNLCRRSGGPRYTYLVYGPLMFIALDGLSRAVRQALSSFSARRSDRGRGETDMLGDGLRAGRA